MAELSFTPGQRRLLVALRKLYLRNLGVLARRRQHLAVELQVRCACICRSFSSTCQNAPDVSVSGKESTASDMAIT